MTISGLTINCNGCPQNQTVLVTTSTVRVGTTYVMPSSPIPVPGTFSITDESTTDTPLGTYLGIVVQASPSPRAIISSVDQLENHLCSVNAGQCPVLEIDDMSTGNPVPVSSPAGPPPTVVGNQMNLSVRVKPGTGTGSYALSDVAWTIDGNPIAGYDFSGDPPSPFTNADSLLTNPKFYWLAGTAPGTTFQVSVTAHISGIDHYELSDDGETAYYTVEAPKVDSMTATAGTVQVGTSRNSASLYLEFGAGVVGNTGVVWHYKADAAQDFAGNIAGSQQIYIVTDSFAPQGCDSAATTTGFNSDSGPLYQGYTSILAGSTNQEWTSTDSPGTELSSPSPCTSLNRSDQFKDWFMFEPQSNGSHMVYNPIWIPMGTQTWQWQGQADYTTPHCSAGQWCLASGSDTVNPATILSSPQPSDEPSWPCIYPPGC